MSAPGATSAPAHRLARFRSVLAAFGFVFWFLAVIPPFAEWARRYEYVEAIQFAVFAVVTPALLVNGAPWRRLGLAARAVHRVDADGALISPREPRWMDRRARSRGAGLGHARSVTVAVVAAVIVVIWRWSGVVDAVVRHPWLVGVESVTLVGAGLLLWIELVESPPLTPVSSRPFRIGLAASSMWVTWVVAYLYGMSSHSWYHAFHHVAGQGLSLSADQQFTAGVLMVSAGVAFVPVVFWNLIHWLASEEDPDNEFREIVREHRARGNFDASA